MPMRKVKSIPNNKQTTRSVLPQSKTIKKQGVNRGLHSKADLKSSQDHMLNLADCVSFDAQSTLDSSEGKPTELSPIMSAVD